jgi:hypothetical protein
MNYRTTREFERDYKRQAKRYWTLDQDFSELKKLLDKLPMGTGKHFAVLHSTETVKIVKARFFCRSLKGSSLRIIYAYQESGMELIGIEFIEVYYKGDKEREDKERIKRYLDNI